MGMDLKGLGKFYDRAIPGWIKSDNGKKDGCNQKFNHDSSFEDDCGFTNDCSF